MDFDWQDFARRFLGNGALGQMGAFGKGQPQQANQPAVPAQSSPTALPVVPPPNMMQLVKPPAIGGYPTGAGMSQSEIDAILKAIAAGGVGQQPQGGMPMGGLMNMPGMGGLYQMLGKGK